MSKRPADSMQISGSVSHSACSCRTRFVLLHHGESITDTSADLSPRPTRQPSRRVALVRHARRTASTRRGGFEHFADFGLHHQRTSRAILPELPTSRPASWRLRRCDRGAHARIHRIAELQVRSQCRGTSRPYSPGTPAFRQHAELNDQHAGTALRADRTRCRSSALNAPAILRPNVIGNACCIQVRPAIGVRLVFFAKVRQCIRQPRDIRGRSDQGTAQLQYQAGIHRVLAGRSQWT